MRTVQREIDGPADFELGVPRAAPLAYSATFPEGRANGLAFLIPGFGGDADDDYAAALRRHVVETHGMAAVSVRYHCQGARPSTQGKIEIDTHDHLMLAGLALLNNVRVPNPRSLSDMIKRLSRAGITAEPRAVIQPARGEYQNFGVLQAMDHLAVLGDIVEQGADFDAARIVALGSSHGGFIAQMMAKIAPRTLALVIDNSSYTQPPMEYLGQAASAEFTTALAKGITAHCRTKSGWTTVNRHAPDFYSRDRDLIRDAAYPVHVAATRAQAGESTTIFRMVNATNDGISPPLQKQRQDTVFRTLGFDSRLALIGAEQIDGKIFKKLVHGLDASLASLFDMAIGDLEPRQGPGDAELANCVTYECVDSIYSFTHSTTAPYVQGAVTSRFFTD